MFPTSRVCAIATKLTLRIQAFPTHRFLFVDETTQETVQTFIVSTYPNNLYAYDPYHVEGDPEATEANLKRELSKAEREKYDVWRKTLKFNEFYLAKTGRSYLANYLRPPPMHFMWRADYFGQEHFIETSETHFIEEPPKAELEPILAKTKQRQLTAPLLSQYRNPGALNMTLKALSVAPRVFQIDNFLSDVEVNHIVEIASGYVSSFYDNRRLSQHNFGSINLKKSQTGDSSAGEKRVTDSTNTRTSYNSWVPRERTPIIDSIYRRAADLMRIDEALLRQRDKSEHPDRFNSRTLAEDLQLVHYDKKQGRKCYFQAFRLTSLITEYTAHHDFGYSRVDATEKQGARFATLLLYLNEGMKGGETNFPRWVNAHTFRDLRVTPEAGKAVLFYSQLPDGNLDDFSQHAALPVTDGEKVCCLPTD